MRTLRGRALCAVGFLMAASGAFAAEGDISFDVSKFKVEGNTLLPESEVERLVTPFVGQRKVYGDIQKALEALEGGYRSRGYGTVQVFVPEQELASGVVRLVVTEGVIGKVNITGNKYFDSQNIRASLPQLKEGVAPNMRALSENVQLANENPAKQIDLTLGVSEEDGKVDAKVAVTEDNPEKFSFTIDNTGTAATGNHRVGFAYQNANLGNTDQVLTLAYTTAPDQPPGVKVDIISMAYRLPMYSVGDSIDLIYGNSNVNTPAVQATGFGIAGRGEVFGVRWNHIFPRQGEYASRVVFGVDYKHMNTRCTNPATGVAFAIDPPVSGNAACTPYTVRPVSVTYTGQWQKPGEVIDFNIGALYNISMGNRYSFANGLDRYTVVNQGRSTPNDFVAARLGASYMRALPEDWQVRLAVSGQYTPAAIVPAEQFSLAGSTAVRGFRERAVATDIGWVANFEFYSPDFSAAIGAPGSLRGLIFYDAAGGFNYYTVRPTPLTLPIEKASIASLGGGLRFALDKKISGRFDLARVVDSGPVNDPNGGTANTETRGDWRAHFSMLVNF